MANWKSGWSADYVTSLTQKRILLWGADLPSAIVDAKAKPQRMEGCPLLSLHVGHALAGRVQALCPPSPGQCEPRHGRGLACVRSLASSVARCEDVTAQVTSEEPTAGAGTAVTGARGSCELSARSLSSPRLAPGNRRSRPGRRESRRPSGCSFSSRHAEQCLLRAGAYRKISGLPLRSAFDATFAWPLSLRRSAGRRTSFGAMPRAAAGRRRGRRTEPWVLEFSSRFALSNSAESSHKVALPCEGTGPASWQVPYSRHLRWCEMMLRASRSLTDW